MSRETAAETVAVVLTLGILASPVRAELLELTDTQLDNVTAGAFTVVANNPLQLTGYYNAAPVTLQSTDNGLHYTGPGNVTWTTQVLYISTTQGFAVGVLYNPQYQYWDGGYQLPPTYVTPPFTLYTNPSGLVPPLS